MNKLILENSKITILIVLYKETFGLVSKTLETLKSYKKIIIDNGHDEDLKKKIEASYEIESYILNEINSGFSAGYNDAIKLCKTKFCLILGPDCIIEEKAIMKLHEAYIKYGNCFIVAPTSYNENSELTYTGGPLPENFQKDKILNLSGDTCVESVLGACMFVKTEDIIKIKMFDENFFLYYSDDDLCRKIGKINRSIIQIYDAKCQHTHGLLVETNKYLKTFIREYNLAHDALTYYHKIDDAKYLNIAKKKTKSYLYKFFLKLLLFQLDEAVKIFSRLLAYRKFNLKIKRRGGRVA